MERRSRDEAARAREEFEQAEADAVERERQVRKTAERLRIREEAKQRLNGIPMPRLPNDETLADALCDEQARLGLRSGHLAMPVSSSRLRTADGHSPAGR